MNEELDVAFETVFKEKLFGVIRKVVGTRMVEIWKRKGSSWWTDEVGEAVKKKKGSPYEERRKGEHISVKRM